MKQAFDTEIVFLAAKRTPFGTFGGALKDLTATDLAVVAAKAALEQSGVAPEDVDHVVVGNVAQTSRDAIYLARHVGLRAGLPERVPAVTVNRLCGSGFEALVQAAMLIGTGQARVVLAGGTESMSQAPHILRGARWGMQLGRDGVLEDSLWASLTDTHVGMAMGETAEKVGAQYGITQEEVDAFSVLSQKRWAEAHEAGRFANELVPMDLPGRKGQTVRFERDEHPRPDSTVEGFARLPKVFKKDGLIHAGAASGICDGAAMLVLASADYAREKGLSPIGRLVNWGVSGCDPTIMGIGPVPAVQNALARTGTTLDDYALFEVNEAFAPQYLAVEKALGLPRERTNVNGGAIALGHPLGASGARITGHLLYELARRKERYGIGSACIGGGQGIAV
ncbi:MAG TPA: acetyl-CoA C-acetyltransferase, partial [Fredinandcohnia sp.]|nr:acetyl-CoA C-acetyltransferase [Fredinandcohnia sp.]